MKARLGDLFTRFASQRKRAASALGAFLSLALVFGVALASGNPPTVAIEPPTAITYNSAHISGTVNPEDNETYYAFEYAIDPDLKAGARLDSSALARSRLVLGQPQFKRTSADSSLDPNIGSA